MRYRFCPYCGVRYTTSVKDVCPECGRALAGEPSPSTIRDEAGTARAEPPLPPPAPQPRAQDGQFRCPHCGEALYVGEQVCWKCARRVREEGPAEWEVGERDAAPAAMGRGWPAPDTWADHSRPAGEAATINAYWSLGLGVVNVLTFGLFLLPGIIAIWLGVRALRQGAGAVAVTGIVLAAVGTSIALIILGALALLVLWGVAPMVVGAYLAVAGDIVPAGV
jgi:hypothetical protein